MPVNTRASNVNKHPGGYDLSDSGDESSESKQDKKEISHAQKQEKASKKAAAEAKNSERDNAQMELAKLEIKVEDNKANEDSEYPRHRKSKCLIIC
jgi:hypothetical protein